MLFLKINGSEVTNMFFGFSIESRLLWPTIAFRHIINRRVFAHFLQYTFLLCYNVWIASDKTHNRLKL